MALSHNLDIKENYIWKIHTPNTATKLLPFYINEIGVFESGMNFFTRRNEQHDYEILYTVDGLGEITYKGNTYLLEKNNVFFLDCYEPHYYKSIGNNWKFNWMHINGSSVQLYYNNITYNSNLIHLNNMQYFNFHYNVLLDLSPEQNLSNSFSASQYILLLLTELYFSNSIEIKPAKKYSNEIQIALDYIKNNYNQKIRLDDICKLVHLSKYYFISIFKSYTGSTPIEYIINYRIGKAKNMLRTTTLPIKEICYKVGFNDESYFNKIFKKINNITPNKYRFNG